jgi:hypothetical protein
MRVVTKKVFQPHATPSHIYYPPSDIFDREVLKAPEASHEDEHSEFADDMDDAPRLFRCKHCEEILSYYELDGHECEE